MIGNFLNSSFDIDRMESPYIGAEVIMWRGEEVNLSDLIGLLYDVFKTAEAEKQALERGE